MYMRRRVISASLWLSRGVKMFVGSLSCDNTAVLAGLVIFWVVVMVAHYY